MAGRLESWGFCEREFCESPKTPGVIKANVMGSSTPVALATVGAGIVGGHPTRNRHDSCSY